MDKELFAKIVGALGDTDLDDFSYEHEGKRYCFKGVGDDSWDDQGKYQFKTEQGQLIEEDKNYKEIQSFSFGVERGVARSGSYFTDYHYQYEPYDAFQIVEVLVPEVVIPAHTEEKWASIDIDFESEDL